MIRVEKVPSIEEFTPPNSFGLGDHFSFFSFSYLFFFFLLLHEHNFFPFLQPLSLCFCESMMGTFLLDTNGYDKGHSLIDGANRLLDAQQRAWVERARLLGRYNVYRYRLE